MSQNEVKPENKTKNTIEEPKEIKKKNYGKNTKN